MAGERTGMLSFLSPEARLAFWLVVIVGLAPGITAQFLARIVGGLLRFRSDVARERQIDSVTVITPPANRAVVEQPVATAPSQTVATVLAGNRPASSSDTITAPLVGAIAVSVILIVVVLFRARHRKDPKRFADAGDRADVLARWGDGCAYRRIKWYRCSGELQMDHQHPHSLGGDSDPRNFQLLCEECNRRKSDTPNAEYVRRKAIPVVGHLMYLRRWVAAEIMR